MTQPVLVDFKRILRARLRAALEANGLAAGRPLDQDIRTLAQFDRDALRKALNGAARDMFGGSVPFDRPGDAVSLFVKFVYSLLRAPRDRFWFNDYMFNLAAGDEILDPLRVFVTDKEYGKLYVKSVLGEDLAVPTLAILDDPAAVDSYTFPDTCVAKPTHSSRTILVRKPGEPFDPEIVKGWFAHDYYPRSREANYRTLRPKVIVEPLLFDGKPLIDLNVFCFEGEARMLRMTTGLIAGMRQTCLSLDWEPLAITRPRYRRHEVIPDAPACLEEVKRIAVLLAVRFSFIRIDFLVRDRDFHVGEITNLSGGAIGRYAGAGEREMSLRIFGDRALQ